MNEGRYNLRNRGECRIPIQLQLASDVDFLTASGKGADSSKSGQVVTDLSDSGSDIDISALIEHSDQNLSSSPVVSGHGVQKARQGQASQASGSNVALMEQQHINTQILSQLSAVVKSELINGRVSIILMINEANNKYYAHIQFLM